jgi:hypothetical protein
MSRPEPVAYLALQHLPHGATRELQPELDVFGCLERAEPGAAEPQNFLTGDARMGLELDDGGDGFAPLVIRNANQRSRARPRGSR